MTTRKTVFALFIAATLASPGVANQFTILHDFSDSVRGYPVGLTLVDSKLVGATQQNNGIVYSMNLDGSAFQTLHTFAGGASDGAMPADYLTQSGSKLFGTTLFGGPSDRGTVFAMNGDGSGFQLLRTFSGGTADGKAPASAITVIGSTLFGTTESGGASNRGTAFSMNSDGSNFQLLHSFVGDGPSGALTLVGSTLIGKTDLGGATNNGTIWAMNTNGTGFQTLHSFAGATDGSNLLSALTQVGSTLIGTTFEGGPNNGGTLFAMNLDGSNFHVLHAFGGAGDGRGPQGGVTLVGETLFGTTYVGGGASAGTVYSIALDGSEYNILHAFGGPPSDGKFPNNNLVLVGSTLYGVTQQGGALDRGTVFAIGVPEPSTLALSALGFAALVISRWRRRQPGN